MRSRRRSPKRRLDSWLHRITELILQRDRATFGPIGRVRKVGTERTAKLLEHRRPLLKYRGLRHDYVPCLDARILCAPGLNIRDVELHGRACPVILSHDNNDQTRFVRKSPGSGHELQKGFTFALVNAWLIDGTCDGNTAIFRLPRHSPVLASCCSKLLAMEAPSLLPFKEVAQPARQSAVSKIAISAGTDPPITTAQSAASTAVYTTLERRHLVDGVGKNTGGIGKYEGAGGGGTYTLEELTDC
jgi:hypothetical protein